MENNNHKHKIKLHERLARIDTEVDNIDKRLGGVEEKLDKVRIQIANWSGKFAIVSAITASITAGIVSLVVWLLVH